MTTATVHEITVRRSTAAVVAVAVLVALALAVTLPLLFRGTHTIYRPTGGSTGSSVSNSYKQHGWGL